MITSKYTIKLKLYKFLSTNPSLSLIQLQSDLIHSCQVIDQLLATLKVTEANLSSITTCHYWYAYRLLRMVDCNGAKVAIDAFKYLKRYLTVKSLGATDALPVPVLKIRLKNGVPGIVSYMTNHLISDNHIRIILTTCNLVSLIKLPPDPSHKAITDGPLTEYQEDLITSFKEFVLKAGPLLNPKGCEEDDMVSNPRSYLGYTSYKSGCNGPSMLRCTDDFLILKSRFPSVLADVKTIMQLDKNPMLSTLESLEQVYEESCKPRSPEKLKVGKITQISEGGGKTRNIALVDFWSQNALFPFHRRLFRILKQIPQDGTFDQDASFRRFMNLANRKGVAGCFDLSSATERFPLILQSIVVSALMGDIWKDAWERCVIKRDYVFRNKRITWKVGQPLGLYGSWALFTLTHHLFVRWCANDHKFASYCILGDDIGIFSKSTMLKYSTMMEAFGVEINKSKSFVSTSVPVYGEYCKRIFRGRSELSGLSMKLIVGSKREPEMYVNILNKIVARWNLPLSKSVITKYFKELPDCRGTRRVALLLFIKEEVMSTGLESPVRHSILPQSLKERLQAQLGAHVLDGFKESISHFDVFTDILRGIPSTCPNPSNPSRQKRRLGFGRLDLSRVSSRLTAKALAMYSLSTYYYYGSKRFGSIPVLGSTPVNWPVHDPMYNWLTSNDESPLVKTFWGLCNRLYSQMVVEGRTRVTSVSTLPFDQIKLFDNEGIPLPGKVQSSSFDKYFIRTCGDLDLTHLEGVGAFLNKLALRSKIEYPYTSINDIVPIYWFQKH